MPVNLLKMYFKLKPCILYRRPTSIEVVILLEIVIVTFYRILTTTNTTW